MRFFLNQMLLSGLLISTASSSDQIPGAPQEQPIAIVDAMIHTVSGNTIEAGSIVFDKGRIVQVGKKVDLPKDCKIIKASGKHLYPGIIEAHSDIGLVEINSLRDTIDFSETGAINPNVKAVVAFNPDSELIPVARSNGILLAVSSPKGRLLSGRSALMQLDGWTWEDMMLKPDTGMHVRWPKSSKNIQQLAEILDQARRYRLARKSSPSTQPIDLRLKALVPVINRKLPLVVSANSLSQIEGAVAFARRQSVKIIIEGGYDAPHCAKLLRDEKVPVIVGSVYRTPQHRHGAYDEGYTLPKQLQDAGIPYCISAGGRFGASMIRNLPYHAATAAAYGLTEEEALRSITLSPAEILGVADRVGSLQVGLDATLFIADGNILETPTQVVSAFIQGRTVDLDNRHKRLNRKYSTKHKRLQK